MTITAFLSVTAIMFVGISMVALMQDRMAR
jgi:hypothetical protein